MTGNKLEGVVVQAERLTQALAYGKGDRCLDLATGRILSAGEFPEENVGEGRAAVRQGKRFVRIPSLDELLVELKTRCDGWQAGGYEDDDELLPHDPEARELLAPALDIDREAPEWCEVLLQDLAAEETALRWLISLRPAVRVVWLKGGLEVTRVYDPAVGEWADAV